MCWDLGQHTVLVPHWVGGCLVDWGLVVGECHSMVAVGYWATTDLDQREADYPRLHHQLVVVEAPSLQYALLLGVILG